MRAIDSISENRSMSGASEAMAPSRNTMFFTNSISSLGMRAPKASSALTERCNSATSSSGVSWVGSMGGRSRPSCAMTCSTSMSSGSAPRSRMAVTCVGTSLLEAPTSIESSASRFGSVIRPVMPKSISAIFPFGSTNRLPACRSPWKMPCIMAPSRNPIMAARTTASVSMPGRAHAGDIGESESVQPLHHEHAASDQ